MGLRVGNVLLCFLLVILGGGDGGLEGGYLGLRTDGVGSGVTTEVLSTEGGLPVVDAGGRVGGQGVSAG